DPAGRQPIADLGSFEVDREDLIPAAGKDQDRGTEILPWRRVDREGWARNVGDVVPGLAGDAGRGANGFAVRTGPGPRCRTGPQGDLAVSRCRLPPLSGGPRCKREHDPEKRRPPHRRARVMTNRPWATMPAGDFWRHVPRIESPRTTPTIHNPQLNPCRRSTRTESLRIGTSRAVPPVEMQGSGRVSPPMERLYGPIMAWCPWSTLSASVSVATPRFACVAGVAGEVRNWRTQSPASRVMFGKDARAPALPAVSQKGRIITSSSYDPNPLV